MTFSCSSPRVIASLLTTAITRSATFSGALRLTRSGTGALGRASGFLLVIPDARPGLPSPRSGTQLGIVGSATIPQPASNVRQSTARGASRVIGEDDRDRRGAS